jgi:hypothetical protein
MQININAIRTRVNTKKINMNDDEIRPPDKPVRECLLPSLSSPMSSSLSNQYEHYAPYYGTTHEDDQLRHVLEESEHEFDIQLQFALRESSKIAKEREELCTHFATFRLKIAQFEKIDQLNRYFYSELLEYIDKYETGEVKSVKVKEEFYMTFRNILNCMRINPNEKSRLLTFILLDKDK